MVIEKLEFKNLRNLQDGEIKLNKNIKILYGNNAQGKTNLLEVIYFATIGRSHRTNNYKELISFGKNESFISVSNIKIHLTRNSKEIYVDGTKIKKLGELFGNLICVIFSPEDLELVKNGPNLRRKFIDLTLCQLNKIYYYELAHYYKILNQRNNLLRKKDIETIFIWDEQLISHGEKIMRYRELYIKEINEIAKKIHSNITESKENLDIIYKPNAINSGSNLSNFKEKLEKNLERDIKAKSTSVGIHRDDISIYINGLEAKVYGSQGQQRSASLALKLSNVFYIEKEKGIYPIILLDDVFSELDINRQKYLLKSLKGQVIITCTGSETLFSEDFFKELNYEMKEIKEGKIYD